MPRQYSPPPKSRNLERTVGDLIESLKGYDPELPILATWEGIKCSIEVYQDDDGTVMIDADQKG